MFSVLHSVGCVLVTVCPLSLFMIFYSSLFCHFCANKRGHYCGLQITLHLTITY